MPNAIKIALSFVASSREDAWIETFFKKHLLSGKAVASSREDAWIETAVLPPAGSTHKVASSREDAWIETGSSTDWPARNGRVLPRGRVD